MNALSKTHINILLAFLISIFSIFPVSCTPAIYRYANRTANSYQIRVLLKTAKFPISIPNKYITVKDPITQRPIIIKEETLVIEPKGMTISINGLTYKHPIEISCTKKNPLTINERTYFGTVKIIPGLNPQVINYIPIETYLLSVLPSEVPVSFHKNALQAQTIIARTYSYYFMIKNHDNMFDVDDTTAYQVYNGYSDLCRKNSVARTVFRAIALTKSIIIQYDNAPIVAYFHSNSGGRTKSGLSYFGPKSDFPYLISQEDPYSVDQPAYKWEYSMDKSDFDKIFGDDITIEQSDFCKTISNGVKKFDTKTIRRMIGYSKVKSETFSITQTDDQIKFEGYGYGHGVGMSQWGANRMARLHFNYKQIIEFYYPGVCLEKF